MLQILVHGEQHNMMRLKSKLLSLNNGKAVKVKVFSPKNCEELRIPFKQDKTAKVVGKLASIPPPTNLPTADDQIMLVTGVLVQNNFKMSLMAPEDLREYAGLTTTTITCKQRLRLSAAGVDLIKWGLESTFGSIEELPEMKAQASNGNGEAPNGDTQIEEADEEINQLVAAYLVMGCVNVRYRSNGEVELEWEGNMLNDGIADAVMAVLLSVESSPAAVKRSGSMHPHSHSHSHSEEKLPSRNLHAKLSSEERLERLFMFLEAQFGADNVAPIAVPKLAPLPKDSKKQLKAAGEADGEESEASMDVSEDEDEEERLLQVRQKAELERLHKIGIPVPGVLIKVDKMTAQVWLEDLEVECAQKAFGDRVKAVVERAVEVTAPLWG